MEKSTEPEVRQWNFVKFDVNLISWFFFSELAKINIFFAEKLAEAQRNYSTLSDELGQSTKVEKSKKGVRFKGFGSAEVPGRKLQDLKLAFSEYYLSLVLLQNYQNLNYTGFRKILKKHDKNLSTDSGAKWRSETVDNAMFYTTKGPSMSFYPIFISILSWFYPNIKFRIKCDLCTKKCQ